jgi:hypothetical protein
MLRRIFGDRMLRTFGNRMLRRKFALKREGVGGSWRRLHNEELHHF